MYFTQINLFLYITLISIAHLQFLPSSLHTPLIVLSIVCFDSSQLMLDTVLFSVCIANQEFTCWAALRGGGEGVIRTPPRIWQIHLYCYYNNSDDFAPPTFLNCPKRPPDLKSWMQPWFRGREGELTFPP